MPKKLLFLFAILASSIASSQSCPGLINPLPGETDVPVNTTISWGEAVGVPGYRIRLGTTPGGSEITETSVGNATSYTPPRGLPENTEIFVTIILDFLFQSNEDIVCTSQSFTTEDVTTAPGCTTINLPNDGDTDVSVFTNISWIYAPTATSYDVILGSTPGAGDIAMGNTQTLTFNPPGQLPPNTLIYVEVIPRNENGAALNCGEFSFTTGDIAPLPGCTTLVSPANGDTNVSLTPFIEWIAVPGATGYRVTIGTAPDEADILDNAVFFTNSTFVIDFEANRTFFITIVPFNTSGEAIGCGQEVFSTSLGCGPFLDPTTGEFINLNPDIEFSGVFSFCENLDPLSLNAPDGADGYRWISVDQFGDETIISENQSVNIDVTGDYILEAYNIVSQTGNVLECTSTFDFQVVSSAIATIDNLDIRDTALGLDVTVNVSGIGDYEFAIDTIDGPYQDSNFFSGVTPGTRTVYVRDKNGCGIAEETFVQDLTLEGFPKFFTPNGDNINDFWQFIQPMEGETITLQSIQIFDRFGKFLRQIDQNSQGWDGTFNGRQLPSGSYWFKAIDDQNRMVQGFFALKR